MSITFHCEDCKKKVNAPDGAGGKWGRCPHCNHRCYIPLPKSSADEELTLTPLDPNEEEDYMNLMRETYNVTEGLLHQTEEPPEPGQEVHADETKLASMVVKYLRLMADGRLDDAQHMAERVVRYRGQTKKIFEQLAVSEVPVPELQDVPAKVLQGFIRNMLTRLS